MEFSVLDKEWQLLEGFLPSNWKELAHSERAIRRQRGITDAGTLLRVILLHVATGLSLRQASARATASNLAKITDVGLLKRLRTSEAWLRALTAQMYGESRFNKVFKLPTKRRLRAVDATTVEEPGSTGTDWRVHYSIALPFAACVAALINPRGFELGDVGRGNLRERRMAMARVVAPVGEPVAGFPGRAQDALVGDLDLGERRCCEGNEQPGGNNSESAGFHKLVLRYERSEKLDPVFFCHRGSGATKAQQDFCVHHVEKANQGVMVVVLPVFSGSGVFGGPRNEARNATMSSTSSGVNTPV